MNKSTLSSIGLLLLTTAHLACGGGDNGAEPGRTLDRHRDGGAADPGSQHGSGGKASAAGASNDDVDAAPSSDGKELAGSVGDGITGLHGSARVPCTSRCF